MVYRKYVFMNFSLLKERSPDAIVTGMVRYNLYSSLSLNKSNQVQKVLLHLKHLKKLRFVHLVLSFLILKKIILRFSFLDLCLSCILLSSQQHISSLLWNSEYTYWLAGKKFKINSNNRLFFKTSSHFSQHIIKNYIECLLIIIDLQKNLHPMTHLHSYFFLLFFF